MKKAGLAAILSDYMVSPRELPYSNFSFSEEELVNSLYLLAKSEIKFGGLSTLLKNLSLPDMDEAGKKQTICYGIALFMIQLAIEFVSTNKENQHIMCQR